MGYSKDPMKIIVIYIYIYIYIHLTLCSSKMWHKVIFKKSLTD